jgi:ubiquinone/menaquinone biosynthesis C-methylase UbiE
VEQSKPSGLSQGDATQSGVYAGPYGGPTDTIMFRRAAATAAAFLLSHLRPGMRLLDCGCGPGAITLGLAEAVAPGEAIGIDLEPTELAKARALAAERGIANVRFETGNVYELPYAGASFDAVYASLVLQYLRDPLAALKEIRRVLKPGGVVGVADYDFGSILVAPLTPLLEEAHGLWLRALEHRGIAIHYARHQRRLLLEAGFARSEGFAYPVGQGSLDATRLWAQVQEQWCRLPAIAETVLGQGWVDVDTWEAMMAEWRAWGERPDAFRAFLVCAAVGWVAEEA